jgi:hypothetical protein
VQRSAEEYSLHAQRRVIGGLIRRRPHSSVASAPCQGCSCSGRAGGESESGRSSSLPAVNDRVSGKSIGCLAERKLPTRHPWPRNHAHPSVHISTAALGAPRATQADAEGDTAPNQYMVPDVACHAWHFRSHATEGADGVQATASYIYFLLPQSQWHRTSKRLGSSSTAFLRAQALR